MPVMSALRIAAAISDTAAAGITGADLIAGTDRLVSDTAAAGIAGADRITGTNRSGHTVADTDSSGRNR